MKALLDYGAKVDQPNLGGITPLLQAVAFNFVQAISLLLDHGADAYSKDEGYPPLLSAIYFNAYDVLELLIDRGIRPTKTTYESWTALHVAARQASPKTLNILANWLSSCDEADMVGLDLDARDNWGKTAMEVFNQRPDITQDLTAAFQNMLDSLNKAPAEGSVKTEGVGDCEKSGTSRAHCPGKSFDREITELTSSSDEDGDGTCWEDALEDV